MRAPVPVDDVPALIIAMLKKGWATEGPIEFGCSEVLAEFLGGRCTPSLSYWLLPLKTEALLQGGILLAFPPEDRFEEQEREALRMLASIASAALERGLLLQRLERQVSHMQVLHALGESLAGHLDSDALIGRLGLLLRRESFEVVGLSFRDRRLRRYLGGSEASSMDEEAWRTRQPVEEPVGTHYIPMRLGNRIVGTLRVMTLGPEPVESAFLETIAGGVAEVASRAALRAELEAGLRERAVASERGRIAADLHDTVGQALVAIGLLSRSEMNGRSGKGRLEDRFRRLAQLADQGREDINRAIQSLALFPEARGGIASSLDGLARSFERDSGLTIVLDSASARKHLPAPIERVLYRVAHEALMNCWRHSRCSIVRVELAFEADAVLLTVADDGVGVTTRDQHGSSRLGVANMKKAVAEAGGSINVTSRRPRGTVISVSIPLREP